MSKLRIEARGDGIDAVARTGKLDVEAIFQYGWNAGDAYGRGSRAEGAIICLLRRCGDRLELTIVHRTHEFRADRDELLLEREWTKEDLERGKQ